MSMTEDLKAGFTGSPPEQPEGIRKVAQTATDAMRRETSAVAIGAAEHPHAATTLVLAISALAFGLGYLVGRSSAESPTRWR
jgi:alpha-D-ribose 1-methylphosphonate 5-triphosphate synthase subunit PhnH